MATPRITADEFMALGLDLGNDPWRNRQQKANEESFKQWCGVTPKITLQSSDNGLLDSFKFGAERIATCSPCGICRAADMKANSASCCFTLMIATD